MSEIYHEPLEMKHVLDHIIQGTVLGNRDENRLMVCGRVDGRHTVNACRETIGDGHVKLAVHSGVVQTLEELECSGVSGSSLSERADLLNDDVRVALDETSVVDSLGRSEIVLIGVDEEASIEVADVHEDGEGLVRGNHVEVLGVDELGRRHARVSSNDTHRSWVARSVLDLLTVSDGQVRDRKAEVDEVVRRSL